MVDGKLWRSGMILARLIDEPLNLGLGSFNSVSNTGEMSRYTELNSE